MRTIQFTDLKDKVVEEAFWSAFPTERGMEVATASLRFTDGTLVMLQDVKDMGLVALISDEDGIDIAWDSILEREIGSSSR